MIHDDVTNGYITNRIEQFCFFFSFFFLSNVLSNYLNIEYITSRLTIYNLHEAFY